MLNKTGPKQLEKDYKMENFDNMTIEEELKAVWGILQVATEHQNKLEIENRRLRRNLDSICDCIEVMDDEKVKEIVLRMVRG